MDGSLRNMAGTYITDGDKMLQLFRIGSRVVDPSWCSIGGHFESIDLNNSKGCALREVFEETGITEDDLTNITIHPKDHTNHLDGFSSIVYVYTGLSLKAYH